jgi:hypothetical protein
MITKFLYSLILAGCISLSANAADNQSSMVVSLTGLVNSQESDFEAENTSKEDINYGGGLLVEINTNDRFGIETGALFTERVYEASSGSQSIGQKVKRMHIPITARAWLSDYFSLAAGPFVSFQVGDVETYYKSGNNVIGEISTDAEKKTEYGLDGAATLNFALADKTGVFVEARYSSILSSDEVDDEVSALTGLKIDL